MIIIYQLVSYLINKIYGKKKLVGYVKTLSINKNQS